MTRSVAGGMHGGSRPRPAVLKGILTNANKTQSSAAAHNYENDSRASTGPVT